MNAFFISCSLLQGLFPPRECTQLSHCRRIGYHLSHQGSRIDSFSFVQEGIQTEAT